MLAQNQLLCGPEQSFEGHGQSQAAVGGDGTGVTGRFRDPEFFLSAEPSTNLRLAAGCFSCRLFNNLLVLGTLAHWQVLGLAGNS